MQCLVLKIKVIIFLQYNDIAFRWPSEHPAECSERNESSVRWYEKKRERESERRCGGGGGSREDRKRDEQWNVAFLRWGENNSCENLCGIQ
jgi:hypothetical protein